MDVCVTKTHDNRSDLPASLVLLGISHKSSRLSAGLLEQVAVGSREPEEEQKKQETWL